MEHLTAETVTVDDDEGRFVLVIDSTEEDTIIVNIHNCDLDAFYNQVKGRLGPYLREMHEARDAVARGVTLQAFVCAPADVDESGGYDLSDPKHPDWHSVHADLYDSREGK